MTFDEILTQVVALLQREGRVTYRALKRRFGLDEDYLEDLRGEIIKAKRLALDEDGEVLVWTGAAPVSGSTFQVSGSHPPVPGLRTSDPGRWTPAHLAERIQAEREALEARKVPDGERKTITALFADLAGFTALARDLDPEETRALVDPALQLMMDAVHRYEGYVAQTMGDGIFALFGAPIAHEDHPQRALYAALLMQDEMRRYAARIRLEKGVPLQIRVGVNTGEVMLRSIRKEDLHTDYLPVGHSTNIASRMENLANPGAIVVSENTYQLIAGYFECKPLGAAQVKGIPEPLPIYEVLGVGPLRTRLQVAARRGLSRFVGRQRELGEQLLSLAQRVQDPARLLIAHRALGEPLFLLGELAPARAHQEQGIALYNLQQHRSLALLYGLDPGVMCLNFAAITSWHLGYPDQALKRSHEAIMLAQELSHPLSLAAALDFAAMLHQFRRERQTAQEQAEAAITLSTDQGFAFYLALGTILRGWARAEQGQGEEGLVQIRQDLESHEATGAKLERPYFLALMAEACEKTGQVEEGLAALAEALAQVDKTGERWCEAGLYRLAGELSLRMGERETGRTGEEEKIAHSPIHPFAHSSPEACFLKAIEVARKQQAKSWEFRASTSLARLWQQQGKKAEAHKLLSKVYNWFTEGFDTKDLQEAKALLAELA